MIIGLFGFDFISSNKGCEALTYTFLSMMEAATSKDMPMICYSLLKNCVEEWLQTILRNN